MFLFNKMYWVIDGYEQPHDTPAVWAKRIANVKAHLDNVTGVCLALPSTATCSCDRGIRPDGGGGGGGSGGGRDGEECHEKARGGFLGLWRR